MDDSTRPLLMALISDRLDAPIGSDQLIARALAALLAGVDSPSLAELAGLGRREESEARDLFERVVVELDLASQIPADRVLQRWDRVRWLCELVVAGEVLPEVGGRLVWSEWPALGYPTSLTPIVGALSEWEDWTPAWGVHRDCLRQEFVDAVLRFLEESAPSGGA